MSASLAMVPHDALGSWSSEKMALAASIQHTTSESHEQAQPHLSEDGQLAVVFDGFLLNRLS